MSTFFEKMDVKAALYYIDTQRIKLALMQEDFQEARRCCPGAWFLWALILTWCIFVINTFSSFTRKPAIIRVLTTICEEIINLMILSETSVSGCIRQT